jgi:hypothetical protein
VPLLEVTAAEETMALCGHISRRATLLARHNPAQGPAIIAARDRRVMKIYRHRAPKGCSAPGVTVPVPAMLVESGSASV